MDAQDEEVLQDQATDEWADYFNTQNEPKLLITTSKRASAVSAKVFIK